MRRLDAAETLRCPGVEGRSEGRPLFDPGDSGLGMDFAKGFLGSWRGDSSGKWVLSDGGVVMTVGVGGGRSAVPEEDEPAECLRVALLIGKKMPE